MLYLKYLPHMSKPIIDCKTKGVNIVCEQQVVVKFE